jgi:hypothetical protein
MPTTLSHRGSTRDAPGITARHPPTGLVLDPCDLSQEERFVGLASQIAAFRDVHGLGEREQVVWIGELGRRQNHVALGRKEGFGRGVGGSPAAEAWANLAIHLIAVWTTNEQRPADS